VPKTPDGKPNLSAPAPRITFEVDGRGHATALILHTGNDQRATRVP
jgi:hypothetical protein